MARFIAPAHLPDYCSLIDAACNPSPRELAALLGVSAATERAYRARNEAPRAATLALWWEGLYGRDAMDCELVNEARRLYGLADAYHQENARLVALACRLDALTSHGAANNPTLAIRALPAMVERDCFRSLRLR